MWFKAIFILLVVLIVSTGDAFGQEKPDKKDTKEFYQDIESFSDKSKFTRFMHRLFFKPVAPGVKKKKIYKKLIQKPYSSFEGKVIRKISITTLDPFGYSISDTSAAPRNFATRAGNTVHLQSRTGAIQNLLLIRNAR